MPVSSQQITWTPETIFLATKNLLADALGLDDDEVTIHSNIFKNLGAESIDILDISFRLEQNFGFRITKSELTPTFLNGLDTSERSFEMDADNLSLVAKQFSGIDTSHLKVGGSAEDLFSVKFLCEVCAQKLNVPWVDPA